jgi:hypothetical protein
VSTSSWSTAATTEREQARAGSSQRSCKTAAANSRVAAFEVPGSIVVVAMVVGDELQFVFASDRIEPEVGNTQGLPGGGSLVSTSWLREI